MRLFDTYSSCAGAASILFLVSALTLIELGTGVQRPELLLLEGSTRSRGTFCPGETVQLKCIFPDGKRAVDWYVNASKQAIRVDFLARELPGHNAMTPFGNYTIVSIFKEEFYSGNYSCVVFIPSPGSEIWSNSVEVLFEGIIVMSLYNYAFECIL